MLATKNPARHVSIFLMAAVVAFLAGCMASGPSALLEGDAALQRGNFPAAVEKLTRATTLMPEEPRAWNLLGLAYHRGGQPQLAAQAYRRALERDRSNLVSVARFNLGCLLLEQGNASAAADELRSFTMVTNSAIGLVKLGQAQLRMGQYKSAERSFADALHIDPRNAEAYNNLGVLYYHLRKGRDAVQYVNAALQVDAGFSAALLNSAVLAHQSPATRSTALARYEAYLALQPQPDKFEVVTEIARGLEAELAPPTVVQTNTAVAPPSVLRTNAVASSPARTNEVAAAAATNVAAARTSAPPRVQLAVTSAPVSVATAAPPISVTAQRTNAVAASTNVPVLIQSNVPTPRLAVTNTPPPTAPATSAPPVVVRAPVAPSNALPLSADAPLTNSSAPRIASAPPSTNAPPPEPPVTVVNVVETAPPVVGESTPNVTRTPPPPAETPAARAEDIAPPVGGDTPLERAPKPGLLTRLNPFRSREETERTPGSRTIVISSNATISSADTPPERTFARYNYANPTVPAAGSRKDAQQTFARALSSVEARRTNDALREYEAAIAADPAYADAHYNYALLLMNSGALERSLPAWERVLAIEPESLNARYNFALALRHAGFPHDAVSELERVLEAKPQEARAHLMLANIYAQLLGDKARARVHYRKVIELDPRHPQAPAIRFWLVANP